MPTFLGIPLDVNSSYLRGAAAAPARIRQALRCEATNMWTELGVDLGAAGSFEDLGDLRLGNTGESVKGDFLLSRAQSPACWKKARFHFPWVATIPLLIRLSKHLRGTIRS